MEQRIIICTDSTKGPVSGFTADERNRITRHLEAKGWQVWHWFEDLWLVVVPDSSITGQAKLQPAELRDEILTLLETPRKFILVMEVRGKIAYAGMGNAKGWPWMEANWGHPQ
jgi:hypothetical protein